MIKEKLKTAKAFIHWTIIERDKLRKENIKMREELEFTATGDYGYPSQRAEELLKTLE